MTNRRPQVYFTSDWHIGHANVIRFSKRPFQDIDHMERVLINNYNAAVPPHGTCYFLGDMGLCNSKRMSEVVSQLNGTKVLVLGNHDRGATAMARLGFDLVLYGAVTQIAQQRVTMSHCPLLGVPREDVTGMRGAVDGDCWHGESRHQRFSTWDNGQFHLSGHIHSPNSGKSTRVLGRQYDVGVDANNYRPVSLSQLESWITLTLSAENDWRPIPGFPSYKVNSYGQVKSYKRYKEGRVLSPYIDKDGYYCNSLRVNGRSKAIKVHRAVALAFLDNPNSYKQVNHKNGLKFDNSVDNLEWCSNLTNQRHAWELQNMEEYIE